MLVHSTKMFFFNIRKISVNLINMNSAAISSVPKTFSKENLCITQSFLKSKDIFDPIVVKYYTIISAKMKIRFKRKCSPYSFHSVLAGFMIKKYTQKFYTVKHVKTESLGTTKRPFIIYRVGGGKDTHWLI